MKKSDVRNKKRKADKLPAELKQVNLDAAGVVGGGVGLRMCGVQGAGYG